MFSIVHGEVHTVAGVFGHRPRLRARVISSLQMRQIDLSIIKCRFLTV